ncbi:MAG TPA: YoaK family protein [Amycolatopsis sp.]|uniref:YoaK family protein n=1 Tax=Amycolatopsis sp. TaxID=37632 RepID=UPI002B48EDE4|nr:YoaK family protein [Amycolatopsis sp.]HKS43602.1 YoaK family protein [Amycolatopsis sp.]
MRERPLIPLLVALTVVTGLVDAASYLGLGHVFVANQTGNVVLLGFAVGDAAAGLSVPASLSALVSFLLGALAGRRLPHHRVLALGAAVECVLFAGALAAVLLRLTGYFAIVPLGLAMGLQNALVRRLGVPHLNTTVLTSTMTALMVEPALGQGGRAGRRLVSVVAMFAGAVIGGLLVTFAHLAVTIGLASLVLAAVSVSACALTRTE